MRHLVLWSMIILSHNILCPWINTFQKLLCQVSKGYYNHFNTLSLMLNTWWFIWGSSTQLIWQQVWIEDEKKGGIYEASLQSPETQGVFSNGPLPSNSEWWWPFIQRGQRHPFRGKVPRGTSSRWRSKDSDRIIINELDCLPICIAGHPECRDTILLIPSEGTVHDQSSQNCDFLCTLNLRENSNGGLLT